MKRGLLIVISGPSGVGKGTVLKQLFSGYDHFFYSISATTRAPREGEVNGKDYYFISAREFESHIENGDMLEYACYNGCYYGTPRQAVESKLNEGLDVILEIEVQGAAHVKQAMPDCLSVFIAPPSFDELSRRLTQRGTETPEKVNSRLQIALEELKRQNEYDTVIVNHVPQQAADELYAAISAAKQRL